MDLTRRQREILDFITEFIESHRYSPSLEEIAEHFGLSSVATVHKHVFNLEKRGYIKRDWNRSRSITVLRGKHEAPVSYRGRSPTIDQARAIRSTWSRATREDLIAEVVRLRLRLESIEVKDLKQEEIGGLQQAGGSHPGGVESAPGGTPGSGAGSWSERCDAGEHGAPQTLEEAPQG